MKSSRLFAIGFGGSIVLFGAGLAALSVTSLPSEGRSSLSVIVDAPAPTVDRPVLSLKEPDLASEISDISSILGIDLIVKTSLPDQVENAAEDDTQVEMLEGPQSVADFNLDGEYGSTAFFPERPVVVSTPPNDRPHPEDVMVLDVDTHIKAFEADIADLSDEGRDPSGIDVADIYPVVDPTSDLGDVTSISSGGDAVITAARVKDGIFLEVEPEASPKDTKSSTEMIFTPDVLDRLSVMDSSQIESLALLISAGGGSPEFFEIMRNRNSERSDTRPLSGIPGLSSPGDIPEPITSRGQPREDEKNVLLRGWTAEEDTFGNVFILRFNDPSSKIDISTGMALGPFGRVTGVDRSEGEIKIALETGGEITGAANPNRAAPIPRPKARPKTLASRE